MASVGPKGSTRARGGGGDPELKRTFDLLRALLADARVKDIPDLRFLRGRQR